MQLLAMFCHVRRELERSGITATFSNKKRKTSGVVFTLMVSISTAGDTRDFRDGKKSWNSVSFRDILHALVFL